MTTEREKHRADAMLHLLDQIDAKGIRIVHVDEGDAGDGYYWFQVTDARTGDDLGGDWLPAEEAVARYDEMALANRWLADDTLERHVDEYLAAVWPEEEAS